MAKHAWKGIKFLTLHEVLEQYTFFKQIVSGHGFKVACIFKTFRDHGCLTVAYHFDQINIFLVYFTDFSAFFINIMCSDGQRSKQFLWISYPSYLHKHLGI